MKDDLQELKARLQEKKVIVGADRVRKGLRAKTLRKVFLAHNCPETIRKEIQHYASLAAIPAIPLEQNNGELGVLCKKRFPVSVVGI